MDRAGAAGKVWLVGAGPGSADLVTLRALRVLRQADVWLVDDLVGKALLRYARRGTRLEFCGKRGGNPCSARQEDINARMLAHVRAGRRVVRVKGGDPGFFGRGGEEAAFLREHGVDVEIVSGMSAGIAAAQVLGIGLTHRELAHGVSFVTAHTAEDDGPDWRALCASGTTLVIYMGMSRLAQIRDALREAGMRADTPAAVVMNAGRGDERCWQGTVGDLVAARDVGLRSPAVVLVGAVVGLACPGVRIGRGPQEKSPGVGVSSCCA